MQTNGETALVIITNGWESPLASLRRLRYVGSRCIFVRYETSFKKKR